MISLRVLVKLILLVVVLADDDCKYIAGINEGMSNCENYENKIMKADSMQLVKSSENGEDTMTLQGNIEIFEAINKGTMVSIKIEKQSEMGSSEPMWSCFVDLCKSMEDSEAPWAAALQSMEIYECPIETGTRYCNNLTLDLGFMVNVLTEDFVGSYDIEMSLEKNEIEVISCHRLGMTIKHMDD